MKKQTVVMLKSVDEVGEIGDVISVSRGYARNYLIPRQFAILDSAHARELIRSRHKVIIHARAQRKSRAEEQKVLIEQETCQVRMRASETGRLFGSITAHALAEELAKRGIHLNARAIKVPHHRVNALGAYQIPVHLHDEITATLSLQVEPQE